MRQTASVRALEAPSDRGIAFWSAIYIPIVVAMAAIKGGWVAVCAGVFTVVICFAMVPMISRLGGPPSKSENKND